MLNKYFSPISYAEYSWLHVFKNYSLHMIHNFSYSYVWLTIFIEIALSINISSFYCVIYIFLLLGLNSLHVILKKSNPFLSYILQIFLLSMAVCFLTCIFLFMFKMLNIYIVKFIINFPYCLWILSN